MSSLEETVIVDDFQPIATRRKRQSSIVTNEDSRCNSQASACQSSGMSTPPTTPQRHKKRVRFSEPGLGIEVESASSGLTPFIRRTAISSTPPSRRCHSTPARLWNLADCDEPICGTIQFAPLRQVLEGRVKRRIRRNRLSEEVINIKCEKRQFAKALRAEVDRLKNELQAKDRQMQMMRDEQDLAVQIEVESGISHHTKTTLSEKVQELELQILDMREELQQKETESLNWGTAAQDPFTVDDDDNPLVTNYDHFGESILNDELMTTPTRLKTTFPSPPSTAPNTPCKPSSTPSARIEAPSPVSDPEKELLQNQLEKLQAEISTFTSIVALNDDNQSRLAEKLSEYLSADESRDHSAIDSALDTVLTQLALCQSHAVERTAAFDALASEVVQLGFSKSDPEEAISNIAAQFRKARLDLEYLIPGENVEGFENGKLLEMLMCRIRMQLEKIQNQDDSIDQYHEQELLLREQLNTHVGALQDVQKELCLATSVVSHLREEIEEKDVSNDRLQVALEGYREEVKGLEELIERIEKGRQTEVGEIKERLQDEVLKHDTTQAENEGKEIMITELERRLNVALVAAANVEKEMLALAAERDFVAGERDANLQEFKSSSVGREREHGNALALRDARVTELREEIERVNEALRAAHSTILGLKKENSELQARVHGEQSRGEIVVLSLQQQANRLLETASGYINGHVSVQGPGKEIIAQDGAGKVSSTVAAVRVKPWSVVRRGGFLDGTLARKGGKKRRSYDSGLGFLDEPDEQDAEIATAVQELTSQGKVFRST